MRLDFQEIFDAFAKATEKTWKHDRADTVGASEVFDCLRKVWFRKVGAKMGIKQDPDDPENPNSWGAARRGDLLEQHYVVPAVRNYLENLHGVKLRFGGKQQKTLFKGRNSATPDGLITGLEADALMDYGIPDIGSDCIVLEIKSVDPRVNVEHAKDIHLGQVQQQMGLIHEKTNYRPVYAVILYVNASFLDQITPHIVRFDEEVWAAAQTRAGMVYDAQSAEVMLPEGRFMPRACAFCEYTEACRDATIASIPGERSPKEKVPDEVIAEMEPVALNLKALGEQRKAIEKAYEEAKVRAKDLLRRLGYKKLSARKGSNSPWGLSWYRHPGQKRLDREAVIEALNVENLDDFMIDGSPYDAVKVS